jgi:hypothetical protein
MAMSYTTNQTGTRSLGADGCTADQVLNLTVNGNQQISLQTKQFVLVLLSLNGTRVIQQIKRVQDSQELMVTL